MNNAFVPIRRNGEEQVNTYTKVCNTKEGAIYHSTKN